MAHHERSPHTIVLPPHMRHLADIMADLAVLETLGLSDKAIEEYWWCILGRNDGLLAFDDSPEWGDEA